MEKDSEQQRREYTALLGAIGDVEWQRHISSIDDLTPHAVVDMSA